MERRGSRAGIAEAALREGQIDARGTGSRIVTKDAIPERLGGREIPLLRIEDSQIAGCRFIVRIGVQRLLVFAARQRAVAARLFEKAQFHVQLRIRCLGWI